MEILPDGVAIINPDGELMYSNTLLAKMLGTEHSDGDCEPLKEALLKTQVQILRNPYKGVQLSKSKVTLSLLSDLDDEDGEKS